MATSDATLNMEAYKFIPNADNNPCRELSLILAGTASKEMTRKYRCHVCLIIHSAKCLQMWPQTCECPECPQLLTCFKHMKNCQLKWNCEYPMCFSTSVLLLHLRACLDVKCNFCFPIRMGLLSKCDIPIEENLFDVVQKLHKIADTMFNAFKLQSTFLPVIIPKLLKSSAAQSRAAKIARQSMGLQSGSSVLLPDEQAALIDASLVARELKCIAIPLLQSAELQSANCQRANSQEEKCQDVKTSEKSQAAKSPSVKSQTAKTQSSKPQTAKTQSSKPQTAKVQAVKPQAAKSQGAKSQGSKSQAAKPQAEKAQDIKPQAVKPQAVKSQAEKPQVTKQKTANPNSEKPLAVVSKIESPRSSTVVKPPTKTSTIPSTDASSIALSNSTPNAVVTAPTKSLAVVSNAPLMTKGSDLQFPNCTTAAGTSTSNLKEVASEHNPSKTSRMAAGSRVKKPLSTQPCASKLHAENSQSEFERTNESQFTPVHLLTISPEACSARPPKNSDVSDNKPLTKILQLKIKSTDCKDAETRNFPQGLSLTSPPCSSILTKDFKLEMEKKDLITLSRVLANVASPTETRKYCGYLLLILHACECRKEDLACSSLLCAQLREILPHTGKCIQSNECEFNLCSTIQRLMKHWVRCQSFNCALCSPVRKFSGGQQVAAQHFVEKKKNPHEKYASETSTFESNLSQLFDQITVQLSKKMGEFLQKIGKVPNGAERTEVQGSDNAKSEAKMDNCAEEEDWRSQLNVYIRMHTLGMLLFSIVPEEMRVAHNELSVKVLNFAKLAEKMLFMSAQNLDDYFYRSALLTVEIMLEVVCRYQSYINACSTASSQKC